MCTHFIHYIYQAIIGQYSFKHFVPHIYFHSLALHDIRLNIGLRRMFENISVQQWEDFSSLKLCISNPGFYLGLNTDLYHQGKYLISLNEIGPENNLTCS